MVDSLSDKYELSSPFPTPSREVDGRRSRRPSTSEFLSDGARVPHRDVFSKDLWPCR